MSLRAQPLSKKRGGCVPEWDRSLLAPFAAQSNRGAGAELKVLDLDGGDLGHACPRVVECGKEHPIAAAGPGGGVRCCKYRFDLLATEKSHLAPLESLHRDA